MEEEEEAHTSGSRVVCPDGFKALLEGDILCRGNRGQQVSPVVDMKRGVKCCVWVCICVSMYSKTPKNTFLANFLRLLMQFPSFLQKAKVNNSSYVIMKIIPNSLVLENSWE